MPIETADRHDGAGVIYRCHGAVSISDFIEAGNSYLAFPNEIQR
jgi:hypothetical protein